MLDRQEYLQRLKESQAQTELVRYPLEKLEFNRRTNSLNILVVSVNNLRSDVMTPEYMPNAANFATQNLSFTNHYSSSNDTFGVFGLFYGLPSSYVSSIKMQGSRPILLDTLLDKDYSFGLFSGDNFDDDLYGETIFRGLNFTGIAFNDANSPDTQAINVWADWVEQRKKNPWFSFIELTTVDNFSTYDDKGNHSAVDKLQNGYHASAAKADEELGILFDKIEQLGISESTVVILTSNHGTEFNETKTNSWGSNSNYSRYQLQVPMVIHWPGKVPTTYDHRTSHLDLSVTLLQDLLGVSSNPSDFSSGQNLFDESPRKWILAGGTRELALITNKDTTVIDKFGNYKLYDGNYQRLQDKNPTLPVLMQGLTELQRFYAKSN
ncbi:hypothetical protein GCM10007938_13830 [Vibrio zhanjiangensis]|uniref:Sulfatase N-terminal domain-containing protein n=1 Tax=Vibrio zhanjiangensis TaxID=1046128 RepID=A0ABQ6EWP9_9VIBR|nr:hypothetical protein GCM10007938_13830 [Vibrio zhanjiangensis]